MTKKTTPTKLTDSKKLKIRNDFVQGIEKDNQRIYPTLDELIKKYKVAQSTVYRTARKDNWKLQKEQFQANLAEELDKERKKDLKQFIREEQAEVRKEQAERQRKFLEQIKLEKKIQDLSEDVNPHLDFTKKG